MKLTQDNKTVMHRNVRSMRCISNISIALWCVLTISYILLADGATSVSSHDKPSLPSHLSEIRSQRNVPSPSLAGKDQRNQRSDKRSVMMEGSMTLKSDTDDRRPSAYLRGTADAGRVNWYNGRGEAVGNIQWSSIKDTPASNRKASPVDRSSSRSTENRSGSNGYNVNGQHVNTKQAINSSNPASKYKRVDIQMKDYNFGRAINVAMSYRAPGIYRNESLIMYAGHLPALSLHNRLFDRPARSDDSHLFKTFSNPYFRSSSKVVTNTKEATVASNRRRVRRRRRQVGAAALLAPKTGAAPVAKAPAAPVALERLPPGKFDYNDPNDPMPGYFDSDAAGKQPQRSSQQANAAAPIKTFGNPYHYQPGEAAEEYILRVTTFTNNLRSSLLGGTGYWKELCKNSPCMNGGTCGVGLDGHAFACKCPPGFGGEICQFDGSECNENPCQHGGICTLTAGTIFGIVCTCPPENDGSLCEKETPEPEGGEDSRRLQWRRDQSDSVIEVMIVVLLMFLVLICAFSCVVETERTCLWERYKTVVNLGYRSKLPSLDYLHVSGRLLRNCCRCFCCCWPKHIDSPPIPVMTPHKQYSGL